MADLRTPTARGRRSPHPRPTNGISVAITVPVGRAHISRSATLIYHCEAARRAVAGPMNVRMGPDSAALPTRQDGRMKRPWRCTSACHVASG